MRKQLDDLRKREVVYAASLQRIADAQAAVAENELLGVGAPAWLAARGVRQITAIESVHVANLEAYLHRNVAEGSHSTRNDQGVTEPRARPPGTRHEQPPPTYDA